MFHLLDFFLDLVPDIGYRKTDVAIFQYLVKIKLNLKLRHGHSILGLVTNQKRFE